MAISRMDFNTATGDDTTAALRKADNSIADLDSRVTTVQAQATNGGWGVNPSPAISSVDSVNRSATYSFNANTPGTLPSTIAYGTLLVQAYGSAEYTQLAQSITGNELAFRYYRGASGGFGAWNRVWHTGNTTVDVNNFIKKAN